LGVGAQAAQFENRSLAAFPGSADGWAWFAGLTPWASDHLPFRDGAVRAVGTMSREIFNEPPPSPPSGTVDQPVGAVAPDRQITDTRQLSLSAFPKVIEGRDGWLYLGADVSTACLPSRSLDNTLESLHRLRRAVEHSGRQFVLVVAPDKTTVVPEHLPVEYVGRGCSSRARTEFWPRVVAEAAAIDLRPTLAEITRRKGAPVYHPADTHWSHEGALAMTYALADRINPGVTRSWQISPAGFISWPDDISPLIGRNSERTILTYALAPDGQMDRTQDVNSDLRVALRLTSTPVTGTVNPPVRMIADSFTQFATRYLAATFTDIAIVHPDTVAADPHSAGELLAEGDIVVFEVAERHLLGGTSPILLHPVIDEIGNQLARRPIA
jgi:hypothetical protein